MNNSSGALNFDAYIQTTDFKRQIDEMERRIVGMSNRAVDETGKIDQAFKRLGQMAAGYFSFNALSQLPGEIVKVRGEFQQLEISFSTMLRSKSAADKLMGELVETAATTPFSLKEVAAGAKQLIAYGSSASTVVGEIRMLGDVASGVSVPVGDLVYLYGTLKTQGRAYAQDIRQFAGRGIPIYSELAKVLGVSTDKVSELVTAGKVGFPQVEQAFKNMTGAGGMFQGLMEAQSKSLTGLLSNLGDAWAMMLNDIGKQNQGWVSDAISSTTAVVKNYEQVIDILKVAAATYGTYRAAIMLVAVAQKAQLVIGEMVNLEMALATAAGEALTAQQARQVVVSKLLQRAQLELNATMAANPYVAVATVLAALVTAYFVFRDKVVEVKSAQELLAEATQDVSSKVSVQASEIKTLISVLQNQNIAESERLKAYEKLKAISPDILSGLDFQRAKTADLTAELNNYLVSLEKKIRLEAVSGQLKTAIEQESKAQEDFDKKQADFIKKQDAARQAIGRMPSTGPDLRSGGVGESMDARSASNDMNDALTKLNDAKKAVGDIQNAVKGVYAQGTKEALNAEIQRLELMRTKLEKLSPAYKNNEEELAKYRAQLDLLNKADTAKPAEVSKTVEYYNTQIKKLKEVQAESSTTRAEYNKYQAQIDALEKSRNRLTGQQTAAEKKTEKDADKVGPFGSLSYWENVSKKAQEVIDKTPSSNAGVIARQNAIKLDADRKAEDVRKSLVVKSFDEELEEKKKQYELYQKWVNFVDKDSADSRFADLKKEGATYLDYLNSQIAKLEARREEGTLSPDEATNLVSLTVQRNEASGGKEAIDVFREELAKTKEEAKSLTEYLELLKQKQSELDPKDNSKTGIDKRRETAQEINGTQREIRKSLVSFLQSVSDSEEQRLAIAHKYADLRLALEQKSGTDRGKAYQDSLNAINQAEKQEVDDAKVRKVEESQQWKDLNKVILEEGRKAVDKQIEQQKKKVEMLKNEVGEFSEAYRAALKVLHDLENQKKGFSIDDIKTFASLAGELGNALTEVNGNLGNAGRLLSGIASQANNVITAFDKKASETDKIAAGVQGVIGLVNILTSSANERRKAEEEYYRSMTAQQNAYNLALNNQIGLQSELNESVFVKDFQGRLKDGVSKLNAANKRYQEALAKLDAGQAKTGQRNAVNWNNVGAAAGAGAAIGSVLPGIGTAIGAVVGGLVGGIVGLFGGKKKEDVFGGLLKEYPELVKKGADGWEELDESLAQTLIDQNLVDENTKQLLQNTIDWQKQIEDAKKQVQAVISELSGQLGDTLRDGLVTAFKEGTDAATAFGDAVGDILENLLTQMIFSKVMGPALKQLEDEMTASVEGGDNNWVDDFGRFFAKSKQLSGVFEQGLQDAQDAAKAFGINILGPDTKDKKPDPLSGAVKGVTEETAGILAGQINAIRISQAEGLSVMRQHLLYQAEIATNSRYNHFLESIDKKLDKLNSDPLRAKGG